MHRYNKEQNWVQLGRHLFSIEQFDSVKVLFGFGQGQNYYVC